MREFQYLEHTTDIIIEAYGNSLEIAFQNMAKGVVNVMFDIDKIRTTKEIQIDIKGDDLEDLLYQWIERILHIIFIDSVALSKFTIRIERISNSFILLGRSEGEDIDIEKHAYKTEIKGVTYHEMRIERAKDVWTLRALLDL